MEVVEGVQKLLQSFSRGIQEAVLEMDSFRADTLDKIDELVAANADLDAEPPELMARVVRENGWEERRDRVFGRLFGTDLRDVALVTGWPMFFANQLAVAPGSDTDFAKGDRALWPTQFSMSRTTPFMSLDGRPYFFQVHGLTDKLYRAIERLVKNAKPTYAERWNVKQKKATEAAAIRFLSKILPGAKTLSSVRYWADNAITPVWTETDGVLIYDRTLFVIEAKGGAYTPKPPGSHVGAHINSMKKLVRDAVGQAKRFRDTLASKGSLDLYDEHQKLLDTIRYEQFDQIVLCCVTLDHIDHLASHAEDLRAIGVDISTQPVWCVSVDDLRVYADMFQNPLMFLDFLYEHMNALKLKNFRVMDEMDHLGLYLEHNRYTISYERMAPAMVWGPLGYRDKLDAFYSAVWEGKPASPPTQDMPMRMKQIIDFLAASNHNGRTAAARALLCMSGNARELFAECIDKLLAVQEQLSRPRPYSTEGDVRITVSVNQKESVSMPFDNACEHTIAVMKLSEETDRTFFHLTFSAFGLLENVRWKLLTSKDIEEMDPNQLKERCGRLQASRERLTVDRSTGKKLMF